LTAGLSLPGFLEFDAKLDMILLREISRGGYGSIWLARAISSRLLEASRNQNQIIAKRVLKRAQFHLTLFHVR
jgi:hypothetical protein